MSGYGWNNNPRTVRAMCADGRVRTVRYTAEADTFFTRPASVLVKGKRVSGFVSSDSMIDGIRTMEESDALVRAAGDAARFEDGTPNGIVTFTANKCGRNYSVLPQNDRYTIELDTRTRAL